MTEPSPEVRADPVANRDDATSRPRRPRATLWLLRTCTTLHMIAAIAMPIIIGEYLDGVFAALGIHGGIAILTVVLTMATTVICVLYATVGGGAYWPIGVCVLLFLAEGGQTGTGYARVLQIHIPLGVFIVTAAIGFCWWSWAPRAALPRTRRA